MRRTTSIRLALVAALIALAGARVAAQPAASSAATAPKTTVAKAEAPKAKTSSVKAKAPKKKAARNKKKTAKKQTKTTPATAVAPTKPWRPNNPIAEQLSVKRTEVARARRVLPAGTDLNAATAGFRNYSQFVAALNATESKGLDFGRLKALMTGINMDGTRTNQPPMSLGQATQALHGTATTPPGGTV